MDFFFSEQTIARIFVTISTMYAIVVAIQRHATFEDEGIIRSLVSVFKVALLVPIVEFSAGFQSAQIVFVGTSLLSCILTWNLYCDCIAGKAFKRVDLDGKVFIVTGSNTGLGFETAKSIAAMNGVVVMACRSLDKANAARNEILEETKCSPSKVIVRKLDLCGFDSVRKFIKDFRELQLPLHGLINNAGVMMEERNLTQDGFEMVFTANHLSHFLLTNLLLPDLEKTGGRVVVVSSSLHKGVNEFNFDDVMSLKEYSLFGTYSQSKLANILFAFELQRRLTAKGSKVTSNAVHPGIVMTEVTRNMNSFLRLGYKIASPFMKTIQKNPLQGAYSSVHVATAPELEGVGGKYFFHCTETVAGVGARSEEAAARLWKVSEEYTGLRAPTD